MIKGIFFLFLISFFLPMSTFAVDSDFTIKTVVGDDSVPPTTPTLFSAVPVADSQIDLAWSASTDNFSFGGYVVLRDSVAIATTTLTSFNDVDLTPETLYSYEVYAFDSNLNISTTSNSLATTTLPVPPEPVTPISTESLDNNKASTQTVRLKSLDVKITTDEAVFDWETYGVAKYTLRWGLTSEYNDGYINSNIYSSSHKTSINELIPNSLYFYEIIGHTPSGATVVLKQDQFTTAIEMNDFPPPNVLRFRAEVEKNDVLLSWQLPNLTDIKVVRIVSNPYSYPTDIYDGEVVYEGLGVSVMDRGSLLSDDTMYYTAFVLSEKGEVSSGAVLFVKKDYNLPVEESSNQINDQGTAAAPFGGEEKKEISLYNFDANNINILQEKYNFTFLSDSINLSYRKSFTISIPYESLPRHLKSIIVTLLDPTDNRRSYSFLLKINKQGTAYEATIAPLNVLGTSRLEVEIFDFESQLIGLYKKQIIFSAIDDVKVEQQAVVFPDKILYTTKDILIVVAIVGSIILLLLLTIRFMRKGS